MNRRISRARTSRRVCLCRRHRRTGSVSPNRWHVGDIVRFCSPMRRDLIPAGEDQHGEIVGLGLWAVTVRFFAFPDEPLYLALNEIRGATGTRARAAPAKKKKTKPNCSTEWL